MQAQDAKRGSRAEPDNNINHAFSVMMRRVWGQGGDFLIMQCKCGGQPGPSVSTLEALESLAELGKRSWLKLARRGNGDWGWIPAP
jgi:hypothetical protein